MRKCNMSKKYNVVRETVIRETFEVEGQNLSDAISLLKLEEGRLLVTEESEPRIINVWEKPTGIS